jgi:hypothetical protein
MEILKGHICTKKPGYMQMNLPEAVSRLRGDARRPQA